LQNDGNIVIVEMMDREVMAKMLDGSAVLVRLEDFRSVVLTKNVDVEDDKMLYSVQCVHHLSRIAIIIISRISNKWIGLGES